MTAPPGAGALLDSRYRVGAMIARGGMSTVYRGTDVRLDRPVAIKVMDPRMAADPAFRTRFEREARSAARIDHPAVVDVHDQGEHAGEPPAEPVLFLVMELVDGGTLRDVLRSRGPLGVPAAIAVLEPVLAGLAEAHRLGLVHRDVKPENVLISRTGEVKVADFGLVTAAAQAGASHAGLILGTVAYLSPEQVTTGAADARSDVYAAGILLYEMLTGAPPYTGDTAISVAYRHVNDEVPRPSAVAGDVPPELDAIVADATRRDPYSRPADADAMLAALRSTARRLAVPRVPPPIPPVSPAGEQDTRALRSGRARRQGTGPPAAALAAGPVGRTGTRALPRPAAEPAEVASAPAEQPEHHRARRRGTRAFATWLAVVIVLALLVGTAGWWLGTGRWTAMPSIVGLERSAAERLLADADLVGRVAEAYHDAVPSEVVAATDPGPEARLLRGSEVVMTVSTGRPEVPAVAPGTAVTAAEQAVRGAALNPVRATDASEFSAEVPEGAVVRTDPAAGTVLPVGAAVTLVTSLGAEPPPPPPPPPADVTVPFLIGESAQDASEVLADAGLRVEVESRLPFGLGGDTIVGQDPEPGSRVERGDTVVLTAV